MMCEKKNTSALSNVNLTLFEYIIFRAESSLDWSKGNQFWENTFDEINFEMILPSPSNNTASCNSKLLVDASTTTTGESSEFKYII